MPAWLAELTPVLFDGIPTGDIYPFARRYGALVVARAARAADAAAAVARAAYLKLANFLLDQIEAELPS